MNSVSPHPCEIPYRISKGKTPSEGCSASQGPRLDRNEHDQSDQSLPAELSSCCEKKPKPTPLGKLTCYTKTLLSSNIVKKKKPKKQQSIPLAYGTSSQRTCSFFNCPFFRFLARRTGQRQHHLPSSLQPGD